MIASDPCASSRAKAGHARGARHGFRGGPRAPERKLTPCLDFRSVLRGEDMILRRAEEGAVKCALRDLRRLLLTEVEYFILACRLLRATRPLE